MTIPRRRFIGSTLAGLAAASVPGRDLAAQLLQPPAAPKSLLQLQQEFVELRFGMFTHFNLATFQNREWGDPHDPPAVFDPASVDTDQWIAAAKSAGMTWACLTTKHHDGFCLWPTATKVASIRDTRHGGDIVRSYVDSCRRAGLKVALYLSILDLRNDIRHFNVTAAKVRLIKTQITELLTQYGDVALLIFDGWDAPWSRISYDEVPFAEIYRLVKRLQPNCLIADLNASQYPATALYYSDIKSFEQNAGQRLPGDSAIPALSCVTLTDGWFWKEGDEHRDLKSVDQVVNQWLLPENALHCNLILNAPPGRDGKLAPNVVARMGEIGRAWKHAGAMPPLDPAIVITTPNLATGQPSRASDSPDTVGPDQANDGSFSSTFYLPEGQRSGWLEIDFRRDVRADTLVLVEPVGRWKDYAESRIGGYRFQRWDGKGWIDIVAGATPSRVQIHRIAPVTLSRLRLAIDAKRDSPHVAEIGVYDEQI